MKTFLIVEVTQDDIDHGVKGKCTLCPIATAVLKITGITRSHVYTWGIVVHKDGSERKYRITKEAVDFMCKFDDGKKVQPFSFIAELIQ